jgi:hypothetical protein
MWRASFALCVVGLLAAGSPVKADIFSDAEARVSSSGSNSVPISGGRVDTPRVGSGIDLIGVQGADGGPVSQPAPGDGSSGLYTNGYNQPAYQPAPNPGQTYSLPRSAEPWAGSWLPFYQCSLSFWRPYYENGIAQSPLEKFDTVIYNQGGQYPFAAGFEATDGRREVAQASGLEPGHNLAPALAQHGNPRNFTIPWRENDGSTSQVNVGWWGHCNGWAAASVSFPESMLGGKRYNLNQSTVRSLRRPTFDNATGRPDSNGLGGMYQHNSGSSVSLYTADLKCILTEYGMRLSPNWTFWAGRRYDAPSADFEENSFQRRSDGSVIIPQDAQQVWLTVLVDGRQSGGYIVPRGYPENEISRWRNEVETSYRQYYPGRQVQTMMLARYSNLPMAPTADQLGRMPLLPRKAFLDVYPHDFLDKMVLSYRDHQRGMIAETSPGAEVWNYPIKSFSYAVNNPRDVWYYQDSQYSNRSRTDPSALFNLIGGNAQYLGSSNGYYVLRYRTGTIRMVLQEPDRREEKNYNFIAFYGAGDRLVGSTWLGNSMNDHPDFCWSPQRGTASNPNDSGNWFNPYVTTEYVRAVLPELESLL